MFQTLAGSLIVIILIIGFNSIKIVRQAEVYIIERLGKFHRVANAGLNVIIPFFDRVRAVINMRQQTMDIPPQSVITRDNVTITIDTVVFFQITDPAKAVYEIDSLQRGITYLAITTIRDIIGKMDLDSTFSSRENINSQLRQTLDVATDKWGCRVDRVEVKDIKPPVDIRDAMEKQMNAERTKRALILQAEGERQSAITRADGEKEAVILRAEAEKQSNIRRAEGVREAKVLEAIGEAEAIMKVAEARAKEIEFVYGAISNAKPDDRLIEIKALETLQKVSEGSANKIFIPFETTKTLASLGAIKEIFNREK